MALPSDPHRRPASPTDGPRSKKSNDLSFAPLSQGLGFHPFSDGLPYAPVSKSPTNANKSAPPQTMGTGAMAAGLPSFLPPPPSTPASSRAPIHAPRIPVAPAHRAPFAPRKPLAPSASSSKAAAEAIASRLTPEMLQPTYGFGYLFKRAFAYLIDTAFNLALCAGALSGALWKQELSPELLLNPGIIIVAALFLAFFNWAITTAEEVAFGTSIGKRIFGLAIQGSASAIFLRAFFFIPSACFGGIGLLWSVFDRRRRCWHDLVVDLQPMEIARL
jgi:uncharacterized RDD family membrane protein YckC